LHRILLAFRSFFNILFHGALSDATLTELGLSRRGGARPAPGTAQAAAPAAAPAVKVTDGALQILSILQRDSRLIDFVMEDISAYSDDQVGAAVRGLHDQARECLARYVSLSPVIDGVEGTYTKAPAGDSAVVKFIGNVPAGAPPGGVLRHKGWRAAKMDLPPLNPKQDASIIAPAEIEIE
jgi:Domain of unknown function (DUF2760)